MRWRSLAVAGATACVVLSGSAATSATTPQNWLRYGYDAARSSTGPAGSGVTAANVAKLDRRQIAIDGTIDSSPLYATGARVRGGRHNVIVFTTTYGKTEVLDADSGAVLWRFVPPGYATYAGSPQITTMTPLIDLAAGAVFAGAPDGRIRRLALVDGHVEWTTTITRDPTHEKLASPLNLAGGLLLAATDGYIGDAPPYQGHVVSLNPKTGRIVGIWNALCSDRHVVMQPSSCPESDAAIWGRAAPVVDPSTGHLLVTTGNARFDDKRYWGDSMLVLSADASTLLAHWTPKNEQELNERDLDLGSSAPAVLAGGYAVQGGKDGELRLLNLKRLAGVNATTGGEVQTVDLPGKEMLFAAPAVWQGQYVFVANAAGTQAWILAKNHRLVLAWNSTNGGSSPVVSDGLLYVQWDGGIHVYEAATGSVVATLPIGDTHWQSPIVVDGRVIAAEGNANDHALTGTLNVFSLPKR